MDSRMSSAAAITSRAKALALVGVAGPAAETRFLEFLAANIHHAHTRPAYAQATRELLAWCERAGVMSIADVKPLHAAAYVERSAPTVKQRLAGIRQLFDWPVTGQVVPVNPDSSIRGPSHSVKRGKTPVLDPSEATVSPIKGAVGKADRLRPVDAVEQGAATLPNAAS